MLRRRLRPGGSLLLTSRTARALVVAGSMVVTLLAWFAPSPAAAQTTTPTSAPTTPTTGASGTQVLGVLTADGKPVEGVDVAISQNGKAIGEATSDAQG